MSDPNLTPAEAARFPSFLTLREAHDALLEREDEDTPETRAAILDFVTRGQATGAVLDAESDRRAAQSLLSYWTTRLYRVGVKLTKIGLAEFDPTLAPELPDEARPYRGLDAFLEDDQGLFFGRESLIADLVRRLENGRLLAVLGASWSGKSSVVRAGLMPALKNGAVPGSEHWRYARPMVPGSNPVAALEHALRSLPAEADPPQPLVLVVDQFEEIFTLSDKSEREAFVGRVLELLHDPSIPHRVILTMRTDFYDRIATFSEFKSEFEKAVERVRPLSAAELRRAIEEPANKVGLKFEEGVVTSLLEDILGEPAALPLLQFTLLQLWEKRQRNRVTRAVYRELGGGRQALQTVADQFFKDRLLPEEREVARRIFLKLVRPSEGLEVTSQRLRRSELFVKAYNAEITERVLNKLVSDARLLRQTEGDTPADTQIEVAHEALVRNWPTLMSWLEDERENVRRRNRLRDQAKRWLAANRDPNLLWRGRDLEEAEQLDDLSAEEADFVHASREALEREVAEKEAARQRELDAARQLAETEKQGARRARRLTLVIGAVGVVAFVAAVIAGQQSFSANRARDTAVTQQAAAVAQKSTAEAAKAVAVTQEAAANAASTLAFQRQVTAELAGTQESLQRATAVAAQQTAVAGQNAAAAAEAEANTERLAAQASLSRQLAAQALNLGPQQLDLALLISVEAVQITDTLEAQAALSQTLRLKLGQTATPLMRLPSGFNQDVISLAYSPDGGQLAVLNRTPDGQGRVVFWNITGSTPTTAWEIPLDVAAYTVAFSHDGKVLAIGGRNGVTLWSVADREELERVQRNESWAFSVAFSPDDETLAVGQLGSTIVLWDVTDARAPRLLKTLPGNPDQPRHTDDVWSVAWSPDGRWLASGSAGVNNYVLVWNVETDDSFLTVEQGHTDTVFGVAWSPNGYTLASASRDNTVVLWDVTTPSAPRLLTRLTEHRQEVYGVAFSRDGLLATGSDDGTAMIWSVANPAAPKQLAVLAEHRNRVRSVAFSPVTDYLATGGFDQQTIIWQIVTGEANPGETPIQLACRLAGRNLTPEEWKRYFPGEDYRKTCPNLP
ncbi:MAG: repeat protein [Anaerolineales bacterium]|nr:repeat protein [Anaerolineales bacterium]